MKLRKDNIEADYLNVFPAFVFGFCLASCMYSHLLKFNSLLVDFIICGYFVIAINHYISFDKDDIYNAYDTIKKTIYLLIVLTILVFINNIIRVLLFE